MLLFVANDAKSLISFRLPVVEAARRNGYSIAIAAPDGPGLQDLRTRGFECYGLPFSRSGLNPFREALLIWRLWRLMHRLKPRIVHLLTIKPVLYGGIAARLARVPAVVAAVTGLGYVFIATGIKAVVLRRIASILYRLALRHPNIKIIFQNRDDFDAVQRLADIRTDQAVFLRGSGVDTSVHRAEPEPDNSPLRVVMVSRLLRDKGVFEYIDAANHLSARGANAHFVLFGDIDPGNPASVTADQLDNWRRDGVVEIAGYATDVASVFANAHIVVLPSYREGLPKVLCEAAASGRPVVTTNVPGCRDAITPGKTGILVPPRDAVALADAIEQLLANKCLRERMGHAGRELAESDFDISSIVASHMEIYKSIAARIGESQARNSRIRT